MLELRAFAVAPAPRPAFDSMLTLTVPGLLGHGAQALATMPSARALAHHAHASTQDGQGLGHALCGALSLPGATPLAPLAAWGAGLAIDDRYVIAATPVTLVADRNIVVLAGPVADLHADEAAALIELINRHFAADDVAFCAPRPSAWFAQCERTFALSTSSIDAAVGRPIGAFLPSGPDANTWQRWQVEIQMLLHEHAINQAREERGQAPVSGVWLSGGGRLDDVATPALTLVLAESGEHGDLARGLAHRAGLSADTLPPAIAAILERTSDPFEGLAAMRPTTDAAQAAQFGVDWLQPAVDALARGRLDALQLIADGHGAAVTWRAKRRSRLAHAMSRLRGDSLDIPAIADE